MFCMFVKSVLTYDSFHSHPRAAWALQWLGINATDTLVYASMLVIHTYECNNCHLGLAKAAHRSTTRAHSF